MILLSFSLVTVSKNLSKMLSEYLLYMLKWYTVGTSVYIRWNKKILIKHTYLNLIQLCHDRLTRFLGHKTLPSKIMHSKDYCSIQPTLKEAYWSFMTCLYNNETEFKMEVTILCNSKILPYAEREVNSFKPHKNIFYNYGSIHLWTFKSKNQTWKYKAKHQDIDCLRWCDLTYFHTYIVI